MVYDRITELLCKPKRQYVLKWKVSIYCLLCYISTAQPPWLRVHTSPRGTPVIRSRVVMAELRSVLCPWLPVFTRRRVSPGERSWPPSGVTHPTTPSLPYRAKQYLFTSLVIRYCVLRRHDSLVTLASIFRAVGWLGKCQAFFLHIFPAVQSSQYY